MAVSPNHTEPCRALALVGRLPASERCSQHQVVVVWLPPVLVGYVRGHLVLLAPEVEEFLPELGPSLQPLRHLQGALVKRDLQSRDEVLLWYGILARAVAAYPLPESRDGHLDEFQAPLG